jgi:hypothetical protein
MFDRDLVGDLVARATPFQRGLVVTLCLHRAAALAEDERGDQEITGFRALIADSARFCRDQAVGTGGRETDHDALTTRYREILGPDDFPFEEPDGVKAWFVDVVSLADYAVRCWHEPELSEAHCLDVLLSSYSLAGMLEADPETPSPESLGDLEAAQQLADLRRAGDIAGRLDADRFDTLLADSARLRQAAASRFQDVLAEA